MKLHTVARYILRYLEYQLVCALAVVPSSVGGHLVKYFEVTAYPHIVAVAFTIGLHFALNEDLVISIVCIVCILLSLLAAYVRYVEYWRCIARCERSGNNPLALTFFPYRQPLRLAVLEPQDIAFHMRGSKGRLRVCAIALRDAYHRSCMPPEMLLKECGSGVEHRVVSRLWNTFHPADL